MRKSILLAVLPLFVLARPQALIADPLIVDHLADLAQVRVKVLVPRYKPIPGISPDALETTIEQVVSQTIFEHRLQVVESANPDLVFSINYEEPTSVAGTGALLVFVELREPATLERSGSNGEKSQIFVTSWRDSWLDVISSEDALEHLLEAARILATAFCEEILQSKAARANADDQTSGSDVALEGIEKPATKILICDAFFPNPLPTRKDFYLLYTLGMGLRGRPAVVNKVHDRYAEEGEVKKCLQQWYLPDVAKGYLVSVAVYCDREISLPVVSILGGGIHQEIYPRNALCD